MRSIFTYLAILLTLSSVLAQENTIGTPYAGKTYSQESVGRNNLLYLQQANQQNLLMDFEKTFFALENAVAQNPYSALAYLRRAQFKQRFGMSSEAAIDINIANRLNPFAADLFALKNPYSVLNVLSYQPAEAVVDINMDKRLEDYWKLIDQKHAELSHDPLLLDKLESVVYNIEQGNINLAQLKLDTIITDHPNTPLPYDIKGMLLFRKGEDEKAKLMLQKALELEPNFAIAWYNLSRIENKLGNTELAKQYLDTAIELQEDLTKAYFDRALIFKKQGNSEAAINDYNTIINNGGTDFLEAYLNRGLTRKLLGDFDLALKDLNVAIEAFPDYAELYKNRGNLYLLFGYHARAIEDYTIAIEKRTDYAEALYNRGLVHFITFDRVSGCADLNKSAALGYDQAIEKQRYFCVD